MISAIQAAIELEQCARNFSRADSDLAISKRCYDNCVCRLKEARAIFQTCLDAEDLSASGNTGHAKRRDQFIAELIHKVRES